MENLIYYGDAVKVLGEGRIGGYLVRFTDEGTPDLTGEFFSAETDLGIETGSKVPVYYKHGFDPMLKSRKLGKAEAEFQEAGVWIEAQLELRDEYERRLLELAEAGKLGWSSGAAGHLVERVPVSKSWHITCWPIAEASLTPTPAEPHNTAIPVKSLFMEENMTEETKVFDQDAFMQKILDSQQQAIDDAVKALRDEMTAPEVKADIKVTEDEADREARERPFETHEFFKAVYNAEVYKHVDKRLLPLKASGLAEGTPADGGYLIRQDMTDDIYTNMWGVGSVLEQFKPMPVEGPGLLIPAVNETSRADGSRMGGVLGYWTGEGAPKTASQPAFRQVDLKLYKVAALVYATDELLQDKSALGSWLTRNVPDELRFQVEAAIINGSGPTTQPLGILQSGALHTIKRKATDAVDADDVANLWAARYTVPRDYVWFVNASVMPQLYKLLVGTNPSYVPPGGWSASPYGMLFGRPVIETEYNPALGVQGDLILASPSQYALITKGGIQTDISIHVKFVEDETAFRFVFRVGGAPLWASPVTAYDGVNSISPFVALKATT